MRRLLWGTVILVALYAGYWLIGSRAALQGAQTALSQMQARGLADYSGLSLAGFPSRFDLTVTDPAFRTSDGQWGWRAAFLQVLALSYRPNHIIAVLPDAQTITAPDQSLDLEGSGFRASAIFGLSSTLPLDHAQMVGQSPSLVSSLGWSLSAAELRAALRTADAAAHRYDLALDLPGAAPGGSLAQRLAPLSDPLAPQGRILVQAGVTFDRPLDRQPGQRRITSLDLGQARLFWGKLDLTATGAVHIDANGRPEGRIDLTLRNWRLLLDFATRIGLIRAQIAPTVAAMLGQLALASGDPETLELPLTFAGGLVSLGPVPLGPAPRF